MTDILSFRRGGWLCKERCRRAMSDDTAHR
ncbi:hypothetical protein J2790_002234 [Paenarthrobacter nicotinovorans]|nr:hypothetical protein [Paenarthrobacter nicotinovorans]